MDTMTTAGFPEGQTSNLRGVCLTALLALAVGVAAFAAVPDSLYRTEAIVGVGDPTTPLRDAMTEAAVSAAVSKPVIERAAASLDGTAVVVSPPALLDRLRVGVGLDRPVGRAARLAQVIAGVVAARAGDAPGIVKISVAGPQAAGAAEIATAVAQALVAQKDLETADLRRREALDAQRQVEIARADALDARKKFAALGGSDVDPVRSRAAAAAQTASAQARLDVVTAILKSGRPPLSDRQDLPQTVAALQRAYLDLTQQLANARETYGERHTTVISLQDGVKRAAAALATEWKRLKDVADGELQAARNREAALRTVVAPTDAARRAAIETARQVVQIADAAVARAESARQVPAADAGAVRMVAVAPVPIESSGVGASLRWTLALLAAALAILGVRALGIGWRARPASASAEESATDGLRPTEPTFFAPLENEDARETAAERDVSRNAEHAPMRRPVVDRPIARAAARQHPTERDDERQEAVADIVAALERTSPIGDLPVLLVAADDATAVTSTIALEIGEACAARGHRVLLVEREGSGATLGAAVGADAEPVLVDVFGALRVALKESRRLFIAPSLRNGDRIAAGFARDEDVPLIGDLASAFDMIVVDGRIAADSAELAAVADGVLRVGLRVSHRDDERFLATLGLSPRELVGTLVGSRFLPAVAAPRVAPAARPQPRPTERRPSWDHLAGSHLAGSRPAESRPAEPTPNPPPRRATQGVIPLARRRAATR